MVTSSESLDPALGVWFVAFAVSLLCLVAAAFEFFFKERRSFWTRLAIRLSLLALVPLAVADLFNLLPAMQPGAEWIGRALILGLGVLAMYLIIPSAKREKIGGERVSWGIVGLTLAATLWSSGHFYFTTEIRELELAANPVVDPDVHLSTVSVVGITDQGRGVSLYELNPPKDYNNGSDMIPSELKPRLIASAPSDLHSNCHGWVFTGGKHVVRGVAVEHILRDNGYYRVTEPVAGDLIIYRDSDDVPNHTGLVKATGEDGFVLIESKWGFCGRFMHEPGTQCYSKVFHYYRSDRSGHLLQVDDAVEITPESAATLDSPKLVQR